MDNNVSKQISFHLDTLPRATKKALDFLAGQDWLKNFNWYLAGGTALALCEGIRKSVDLDFFTTDKEFENDELLGNFNESNWKLTVNRKNTVYGELFKAKVSFIAYPFFIPQQKQINYGNVKILHPLDIAVMKVIAVSQRGRKRDFFDLYWCANNLEPLIETIKKLKKQYPSVAHDYHHILKGLIYFDDAETDPDPEIYFTATWKEVKKFFQKEILKITRKLIIGE